jgi:hypothetical protein
MLFGRLKGLEARDHAVSLSLSLRHVQTCAEPANLPVENETIAPVLGKDAVAQVKRDGPNIANYHRTVLKCHGLLETAITDDKSHPAVHMRVDVVLHRTIVVSDIDCPSELGRAPKEVPVIGGSYQLPTCQIRTQWAMGCVQTYTCSKIKTAPSPPW